MRGDSLRDLYAKTLAILGLAILAAVGALVDYWPTATDVPAVALTVVQRPSVDPLPVVDIAALSAVTVAARTVRRERAATARPVPTVVEALPVAVTPGSALPVMARSISLSVPPPPPVVPVPAVDVPAREVALPPAPPAPADPVAVSLAGAPRPVADAEGFFGNATSAVKKTGESIVNTTVKTGTSIIKAFGVLGSAFKKVI